MAAGALDGCSAATQPTMLPPPFLPVFSEPCSAIVAPNRAPLKVPVRVVSSPGFGAWITVGVCINGKGPYTFVVDTGAETSVLDAGVARQLGLTTTPPVPTSSFGCTRQQSVTSFDNWSFGGYTLDDQPLVVGTLASPMAPNLAGLVGADVLSRFGAVRIDYSAGTLTLASLEGAPLPGPVPGGGQGRRPDLPAEVVAGTGPEVAMPVDAHSDPGVLGGTVQTETFVRATVGVTIGRAAHQFVLDTGASLTVVSNATATEAGLPAAGPAGRVYAGLACPVRVGFDRIAGWRAGPVALPDQTVGVSDLPGGVEGLLGGATLARMSPLVVDFRDGVLLSAAN